MAKCLNCQQVKVEYLKIRGFSQDIDISTWKWENVNVDFFVGLPHIRWQHDSMWVIVDRMTKSIHFIPVKVSYWTKDYVKLYNKKEMKLHGVPLSIILYGNSMYFTLLEDIPKSSWYHY